MPELDAGEAVHVKVVDVRQRATLRGDEVVIEFEVLDEGPHLGAHLTGKPDRRLSKWMGTILHYNRSYVEAHVPTERILNHYCRAVVGVTGRLRHRNFVTDVLPA